MLWCKKKKNWGGLRIWWLVTVVNQAPLEPDLRQWQIARILNLPILFLFLFLFLFFFFCSFFFLLNMSKTYSIKYQRHIQTLVKYVRWNFLWKAVKQLTVTSFSKSSILVVSQGFKYASEQKDIEHSIVVFLYNAF